jgi:lipoprotein-anchoring transpeptidase ErfK/SrfK
MHGRTVSEVLPHFPALVVTSVEGRDSRSGIRAGVRPMYKSVLVVCFTLISSAVSAQDCFLFFCSPRMEPQVQQVEPPEPRYDPRYDPRHDPRSDPRYEPRYAPRPYEPPVARQYPVEPQYPVERQYPGERQYPVERQDPSQRQYPVDRQYAALYGAVAGEPFPVPAVQLSVVNPNFLRRTVSYPSNEPPGTIIIDPQNHYLYLVQGGGQAIRYGVGVGRQGFSWSGTANIRDKQAWPDWYPPKEMIQRQPELRRQLTQLRSGLGVAGGPGNPLGARALYLWAGGKDTLYRIHGTNEPHTIGQSVSSGCIRMLNQDVIDLHQRTPVGAKVVVLQSRVS